MLLKTSQKRSHYWRALLLVAFSFLYSASVLADDMGSGIAAYKNGQFNRAWQILKPLADLGVKEAQRRIGVMYRHGLGVKKNDQAAIKWYRRAAEQGHIRAQNSLGIMYRFGLGVKRNPAEGSKWLLAAAKQGDSKAQENIADMYLKGVGVERDNKEAAKWFTFAAKQGQRKAQLSIGLMTLAGRGVKKSEIKGMEWVQMAAKNGSMKAANALAKAYAEGLFGMNINIEKAKHWYKRAEQAASVSGLKYDQ